MGTITPHGSGMSPLGSPQDAEGAALYAKIQSLETDPALGALATQIFSQLGGSQDAATIKSVMTTVLSGLYDSDSKPCDAYMHFGLSDKDMNTFMTAINTTIAPYHDEFALPPSLHYTWTDGLCGLFSDWITNNPGEALHSLAQALILAIKTTYGSNEGDQSGTTHLILQTLTAPDFFTTYPDATPANETAFHDLILSNMPAFPVPSPPNDFLMSYLTIGNWNPANAGDTALKNGILTEMRNVWQQPTVGSMSDIQAWAVSEINGGFADYPNCTEAGATMLETTLGLPSADTPPLQHQLFQARTWLATLTDPHAQQMARDLIAEITSASMWPAGTSAGLTAWYGSTYGNTNNGTVDLFMKYYNVDNADIQQFYHLCTGNSDTITATTADNNYIAAAVYRDTFGDHTTDDYKLMDALCTEWLSNGGSYPNAAQQATVLTWQAQERTTALYTGSSAATKAAFNASISDPEGTALYNAIQAYNTYPRFQPLVNALLSGIPGPPYIHTDLIARLNAVFSGSYGSPPCDFYIEYRIQPDQGGPRSNFISDLNSALEPYGATCPVPPAPTAMDNIFNDALNWEDYGDSGGATVALVNAFLSSLQSSYGSGGTAANAQTAFTNIMKGDIFGLYGITGGDYTQLSHFCQYTAGSLGYTLPDYTQQYLTAGGSWPNPSGNANDSQLRTDLLTQMRNNWGSGATYLAQLQQWANTIINGQFTGYPTLDINGAQNLEGALGVAPPALQTQFFQMRAWMASLSNTSPIYTEAQALQTEISTLWPAGTTAQLQAWYNDPTRFKTCDPYIQYYTAALADIGQFMQIATCSATVPPPTAMDTKYLSAATYRDSIADHSSHDWKLMNALCQMWTAGTVGIPPIGSNPSAAQITQFTNWAATETLSADFTQSTPATQAKFISYFDYSVQLTAFKFNVIEWAGAPGAPKVDQQFSRSMLSIIDAYLQKCAGSGTPPSRAGFQTYFNDQYSHNDFFFMFPGLDPSNVNSLLGIGSFQTPFQPIDTIYANLYNGLQAATGSLDKAYLQGLCDQVQSYHVAPTSNGLTNILYNLLSTGWSQYQPSTQAALANMFSANPILSAYQGVFGMLQGLPAGSVDASFFSSFIDTIGKTIDDPVNNPYSTTVLPVINAMMTSPQWAELQGNSKFVLLLFINSPLLNPPA